TGRLALVAGIGGIGGIVGQAARGGLSVRDRKARGIGARSSGVALLVPLAVVSVRIPDLPGLTLPGILITVTETHIELTEDIGGLGSGHLKAPGVDPPGISRGIGGVLDQVGVLEEGEAVAGLVDQALFAVGLAELLALEPGNVGAVLQGGGGPVAAGRADGELDVTSHAGPVGTSRDDGLGQLGELAGIDLMEDLDPGVRAPIRVGVLVQNGIDDDTPSPAVVGVGVVDEDGLAHE